MNSEQFIIRANADRAYTYSVGEKVTENVYLFRANDTNLTREEAEKLLNRKRNQQQVK